MEETEILSAETTSKTAFAGWKDVEKCDQHSQRSG